MRPCSRLEPSHTSPCCELFLSSRSSIAATSVLPHGARAPTYALLADCKPEQLAVATSIATRVCRLCCHGFLIAPPPLRSPTSLSSSVLPPGARCTLSLSHSWGNATPRRVSARSLLFDSQALSDPISRSSCGLGLDPPWAASDCYRSCCVVDGSGIVAFTAPFTLDPCCLRWLRLLVPSLGALRFQATADQTSSPVRT